MMPEICIKLSQKDIDYINQGHLLQLESHSATLFISKEEF